MSDFVHYFTIWLAVSWVVFAIIVARVIRGNDAPPGIAFGVVLVSTVLGPVFTVGWYVVDLLR